VNLSFNGMSKVDLRRLETGARASRTLAGLHLGGYGVDFVNLMNSMCDINIEVTQVAWSECNYDLPPLYTTAGGYAFLAEAGSKTNGGAVAKTMPGTGIQGGEVHGCMTYTHLFGARERIFEFTHAWTKAASKAAGLITRLVNKAGYQSDVAFDRRQGRGRDGVCPDC